ncbi:hypothetical protein V1282_003533 [Nitrobacteraceae bacterium AZCC 2146]
MGHHFFAQAIDFTAEYAILILSSGTVGCPIYKVVMSTIREEFIRVGVRQRYPNSPMVGHRSWAEWRAPISTTINASHSITAVVMLAFHPLG